MPKDNAKKLEILNKIIVSGNEATNLASLLEKILDLTLELIEFDGGGLYLLDKANNIAELKCIKGYL